MGMLKSFCGLGGGGGKNKAEASAHSGSSTPSRPSSSSTARSQEEEEEELLERVFRKFDANGDGKISAEELGAVLAALGHAPASDAELRAMVAEADADADGDGYIDLGEFVALNTRGVGREAATADLRRAFSVFDANGDGAITAEEVQRVLRSLGDEASLAECRRMVRSVDRDGDGVVSLEEFTVMMRGESSGRPLATDC